MNRQPVEAFEERARQLAQLRGRDPDYVVRLKGEKTPLWLVIAHELRNHAERQEILNGQPSR